MQVSADINTKAIQDALPSDTAVTVELYMASIICFKKPETGQISEYAIIEQTISSVLSLMTEWIVNQSQ